MLTKVFPYKDHCSFHDFSVRQFRVCPPPLNSFAHYIKGNFLRVSLKNINRKN